MIDDFKIFFYPEVFKSYLMIMLYSFKEEDEFLLFSDKKRDVVRSAFACVL